MSLLHFSVHFFCISVLLVRSASVLPHSAKFHYHPSYPHSFTAKEPLQTAPYRLSNPLIGDDGRVYFCLERKLLAFESNGSIAWTISLNCTCNNDMAPVHGGASKLYLVAENKVLKINILNIVTFESAVEVIFGPKGGEIIGLSVSTSSSCVVINVKNVGLFTYRLDGQLLWTEGPAPVLYQSSYHQGCRKNVRGCHFTSVPVIDHCEASIYVKNNEGEIYAMSIRSPRIKWIQDFSSLDKSFTITPGNNGLLYVTVPTRALILALDVSRGTVLWQRSIGPLSMMNTVPVVVSNGWISIGSLDGLLYSFSPTGILKIFPKAAKVDSVVQVSPVLDCSGYAVYISQTQMEGKISHTINEYTSFSAMKPMNVVFTMLVPATGSIYWSESYPGSLLSLLSNSDLQHYVLDETILLAFVTSSNAGNPLPCRSISQKLAFCCSQAMPKLVSIYTGNKRAIMLFLLFESVVLIILVALVRFCCVFWRKKKLQGQDLGKFLEKRHSLRLQKKEFDRTITELEQTAADEAVANEVVEQLSDLVRERKVIERKLSTSYSLGRDRGGSSSRSPLPLYNEKTKSYSFQGAKNESVTIFHAHSDTSSGDTSDEKEAVKSFYEDKASRIKAKAPVEGGSCSDDQIYESDYIPSLPGFRNQVIRGDVINEPEEVRLQDEGEVMGSVKRGSRSMRRRALSSN